MADEKKPKIDLKARLGKNAGQAPPPGAAVPAPAIPAPSGRASRTPPPPGIAPPGVAPPGTPVGPPPPFGGAAPGSPAIDPSNPLAAVAIPYRAPAPAAPPQPQRIEVDEGAVHEARKGARKQGLVVGMVAAVIFSAVGYVAGQSHADGVARDKSRADAKGLIDDVTKAKAQIQALSDKMDAGRKMLADRPPKFPGDLSKDLGGVNVDFDGMKLAGRRFSGFSTTTTQLLVEFITRVQTLNDKKLLIQGLLNKLQKPLTEQFNAPAGQVAISQVVIVSKDQNGPLALLAPLQTPIVMNQSKWDMPKEFNFLDPLGGGNAKLDRYTGGDISTKPGAVYVVPKSFEKVCPSEGGVQAKQLAAQIGTFIHDIKGDEKVEGIETDTKPGMLETADKLIAGLSKVE
jgi:hypothetical protein